VNYPNTDAILLRWNESSKSGCTATFQVDVEFKERIKGMEGQMFKVVAVPIGNDGQPIEEVPNKTPISPECQWLVQRCGNPSFWDFLSEYLSQGRIPITTEQAARVSLLNHFGVASRKQIPAHEIKLIMFQWNKSLGHN
jgi:hypothetical protein